MSLHSATLLLILLEQQSTGKHVSPLGQCIIMILLKQQSYR